jgi:hypothetical protein
MIARALGLVSKTLSLALIPGGVLSKGTHWQHSY